MDWNALKDMLEKYEGDGPLVERGAEGYRLTGAGVFLVTKLLEDLKYFPPDLDMEGFEANKHWAGIMGTHMVAAADAFMKDCAGQTLDEDQEAILSLVALYAAIAQAQVNESLPSSAAT